MKSGLYMTKLANRVLIINNRRTSMRLCLKEWEVLADICKVEGLSRNALIEIIENNNHSTLGLAYMTRLFLISYLYEEANPSISRKLSSSRRKNFKKALQILDSLKLRSLPKNI